MTKQEAAHLSNILKAYSEDKIVQIRTSHGWEDILDDKIKFCGKPEDYRIKPESKYRPYANAEEFLNAQKEHGIYLISKRYEKSLLPIGIYGDKLFVLWDDRDTRLTGYTFKDILNHWVHQDGTPCGILEK